MKWTCERPGRWTGTDGTNTATAVRMREGMIGCNEWMWVTKVNGEHITNADGLREAKRVVSERLGGTNLHAARRAAAEQGAAIGERQRLGLVPTSAEITRAES
ncbi:hypothetical protein [Mycobacteroides abscessus]|uniref:hypothetical protein n=1 Tax=Mycobacteroides abscessus TaxID=36809 RepID=UPI00092B05A7|nr:hypothetical protein [Mycobacteroides abscessus]SHY94004.1 Uncharacterised protein [Mycobacteroides abscessus subsp. abscessus]SHZ90535.1 Uncharacterised protein [Mycobacteroides abscessus subsp. abscessus]SHZ91096.1 Uncharacterised protein [Mycobacteroides abscessus subsp. abscessus]SIA63564.1 Uncharacterised protein [Mycobacteroides abscessus subsp. abscessus]SIC37807.1 Uncharacterised protein [Mycobacteroides abscessus subsp. abscessus]